MRSAVRACRSEWPLGIYFLNTDPFPPMKSSNRLQLPFRMIPRAFRLGINTSAGQPGAGYLSMIKRVAACGLPLLLILPSKGWAACTLTQTDGKVVSFLTITLPAWNPPSFDPTVPVGTVLFNGTGTSSGLGGELVCTSAIGTGTYAGSGQVGALETYPTGIAGVGIRIKGGVNTSYWWPQSYTWTEPSNKFIDGSYFTVELVKTGPITAAGAISGEIGTTTLNNQGNRVIRRIYINGSLPIRPQVPTCKVTTPSVVVPMGNVHASSFTGVGSTSPAKPFNILLTCSGGTSGATTGVYMTLSDVTNPGNRGDTLTLSSDSTAKGVGIQVLDGTTVIKYGADSDQSGNLNQWYIGSVTNGSYTNSLTARYVQSASKITPGSANALATFTMSYQ